jgi:hypothetical protein
MSYMALEFWRCKCWSCLSLKQGARLFNGADLNL